MRTSHLRRDLTHCFDGASPVRWTTWHSDCWWLLFKKHRPRLAPGSKCESVHPSLSWAPPNIIRFVAARLMMRPWVKVSMMDHLDSDHLVNFRLQEISISESVLISFGIQSSWPIPVFQSTSVHFPSVCIRKMTKSAGLKPTGQGYPTWCQGLDLFSGCVCVYASGASNGNFLIYFNRRYVDKPSVAIWVAYFQTNWWPSCQS
jgi:hypothetical protein